MKINLLCYSTEVIAINETIKCKSASTDVYVCLRNPEFYWLLLGNLYCKKAEGLRLECA